MEGAVSSTKKVRDEYDPLTNWRLSSTFNSSTGIADKRDVNPEADLSPTLGTKKQKKSRFAKVVVHESYEDEDDELILEEVTLPTSLHADSSPEHAVQPLIHPGTAVDRDVSDPNLPTSSSKRKAPVSERTSNSASDDVEVLSAKNSSSRRHAFGSKLNPLILLPAETDDDIDVKSVKRQMHIEDYLGDKFTSLHNMLATNMTSPVTSKSSVPSKSSGRVMSPVRTTKFPLAKSALLGNNRETASTFNLSRQKTHAPVVITANHATKSSSTSLVHAGGFSNTASRRTAHQPARVAHTGKAGERTPIMLPSTTCRIPYNVRQHQLSLLIDSCLLEFRNDDDITTNDIFQKCRDEEKVLAESATSPIIYKNRLRMLLLQIKKNHAFGVAPAKPSAAAAVNSSVSSKTTTDPAFADVEIVYDLLRPYLLTTEQLVELGFPYFPNEEARTRGIAESSTAKTNEAIGGTGLKLKRICARCDLPFELNEKGKYVTKGQCIYHPKNAFSRRQPGQGFVQRYLCCDDSTESAGCSTCKHHVSNEYPSMRGFVETLRDDDVVAESSENVNNKQAFSMDCEMLYTAGGVEVAKVTVVNHSLEVVYDSFIVPEHQIVDLNTRFSGLTREDFNDATKDLSEVQRDLIKLFGTDSILIGHSLQSDLLALKLVHRKCVDTSMVWTHRRGPPYKRALRNLMREILQIIIQEDESGHDSKEDAAACMRLMLYKIKQDLVKHKANERK